MKFVVAAIILATAATPALAHDYWLQPKNFLLADGASTEVRLFVGDHFVRQAERPYQAKMTPELRLVSLGQTLDLRGASVDGERPFATIAPQSEGNHLVVMQRDWSYIELEAEKFNSYLEHEGLSDVLQRRRSAGEAQMAGRERYRRYLKALIQVGAKSDATYRRKVGHRLEIIPRNDPSECQPGDKLSVSVLFDERPLKDSMVAVYSRSGDDTKTQSARTNSQGQATFQIDRTGIWLIRLVHMQRCRDDDKYDWESFWAAYSFQVGD